MRLQSSFCWLLLFLRLKLTVDILCVADLPVLVLPLYAFLQKLCYWCPISWITEEADKDSASFFSLFFTKPPKDYSLG